ncbi:MAG TPA: hypothetical protein VF017_04560 [Thermoanaerobaculia bacterium]|nr:hypothetical protein [Thermoanaerobaculia bacterium]
MAPQDLGFTEKIRQLDRQIADSVREALEGLRSDLELRLRSLPSFVPSTILGEEDLLAIAAAARARDAGETLTALREDWKAIDAARSQREVLHALLERGARHASRLAIFLTRPEGAVAWEAIGFDDLGAPLSRAPMSYSENPGLARQLDGSGAQLLGSHEAARFASYLESAMPHEAFLVPVVLDDRLAAVLYADRVGDGPAINADALQMLTAAAAQAIELLPLRGRTISPALYRSEEADAPSGGSLELWEAAGAAVAPAAAAAAEEAVVEEVVAYEEPAEPAPAAELEPWSGPVIAHEETGGLAWETPTHLPEEEVEEAEPVAPEIEVAAVEEVAFEPPVAVEPEAALDIEPEPAAEIEPEPAWAPSPAWEPSPAWDPEVQIELPAPPPEPFPEPVPEPLAFPPEPPSAPSISVGGAGLATVGFPAQSLDVSGDETVLLRRPAAVPPSDAAGAPDLEPNARPWPAERPQARPGNVEVAPPSDFQGRGTAFTPGLSGAGGDPALHEEGRRLARLLVSEIRLYNEEEIEEGKRQQDILSRLREEIERSRKMYEERIHPDVRASRDYFREELVRILADGNESLLGS